MNGLNLLIAPIAEEIILALICLDYDKFVSMKIRRDFVDELLGFPLFSFYSR